MELAPLPIPRIILPARNIPKFCAEAISDNPMILTKAETTMTFFRPILFVIGAKMIVEGVDPMNEAAVKSGFVISFKRK